ncbi:MAG: BrnT family toxin [Selenomonadaceae bacterium]|nr:BrnT family toxin [Selenomonadaceae bacterium]
METITYLNFEWDREKAKLNKIKHGVSFKAATAVFDDPNRLKIFDDEHSFDEERWQIIGMADDILFVVYTERRDKTRIISARVAEEYERRDYYAYGGKLGILHEESGRTVDGGGES